VSKHSLRPRPFGTWCGQTRRNALFAAFVCDAHLPADTPEHVRRTLRAAFDKASDTGTRRARARTEGATRMTRSEIEAAAMSLREAIADLGIIRARVANGHVDESLSGESRKLLGAALDACWRAHDVLDAVEPVAASIPVLTAEQAAALAHA